MYFKKTLILWCFIHFLGICLSATSISPISLFSSSCASPLAALRRSYLLSPRSPLSGRAGSKEQISSSVRATDSGGGFASSLCSHFRFQPSSHLHLKGNQRLSEREKYVNNFSLKKSICLTAWSNALVGYIYLFVCFFNFWFPAVWFWSTLHRPHWFWLQSFLTRI